MNDPIYTGQKRLIPKDQLMEATEWLRRKIEKESVARPEQVERYKETLVCNHIDSSKMDWDSYETSWDFQRHPLV